MKAKLLKIARRHVELRKKGKTYYVYRLWGSMLGGTWYREFATTDKFLADIFYRESIIQTAIYRFQGIQKGKKIGKRIK